MLYQFGLKLLVSLQVTFKEESNSTRLDQGVRLALSCEVEVLREGLQVLLAVVLRDEIKH